MKKTTLIAAVALVAMTGLFAQPSKSKKNDNGKLPNAKEPPKIELPSEAEVKAYHQAELESLKILLDAQVKAKMISQEWADAKIAILKAVQADCKGHCILRKTTDIPFGNPCFPHHDRRSFNGIRPKSPNAKMHRKGLPDFDRRDFEKPDFDELRERHEKWNLETPEDDEIPEEN